MALRASLNRISSSSSGIIAPPRLNLAANARPPALLLHPLPLPRLAAVLPSRQLQQQCQRRQFASAPDFSEINNTQFVKKLAANPSAGLELQTIGMRLAKKLNPSGNPAFQPGPTDLIKLMADSSVRKDMASMQNIITSCGITAQDLQDFGAVMQKVMGKAGIPAGPAGGLDPMSSMMQLLGGGAGGAPASAATATTVPKAAAPKKSEPPVIDAEVVDDNMPLKRGSRRFQQSLKDNEEEGEIVGEEKPKGGFFGNIFGRRK